MHIVITAETSAVSVFNSLPLSIYVYWKKIVSVDQ